MRDSSSAAVSPSLDERWSEEEGFAVVDEWRRSGLKASQFCRERGVGPQRLRYWTDRLEAAEEASKKPEFFVFPLPEPSRTTATPPAPPAPAMHEPTTSEPIEICVGDRITLRVPAGADAAVLARALRVAINAVGS